MSNEAKKVLVVDDDTLVCKIVDKLLSKRGLESIIASDGLQARTALIGKEDSIVLAVVDLVLPNDLTGWDVVDQLRGNAATARIPIMVLTGAGISMAESDRLGRKVDAIVRKNEFTVGAFEQTINRLLGESPR